MSNEHLITPILCFLCNEKKVTIKEEDGFLCCRVKLVCRNCGAESYPISTDYKGVADDSKRDEKIENLIEWWEKGYGLSETPRKNYISISPFSNNDWLKGHYNIGKLSGSFSACVLDKPSMFGIGRGRIAKLQIEQCGDIFDYNMEWFKLPDEIAKYDILDFLVWHFDCNDLSPYGEMRHGFAQIKDRFLDVAMYETQTKTLQELLPCPKCNAVGKAVFDVNSFESSLEHSLIVNDDTLIANVRCEICGHCGAYTHGNLYDTTEERMKIEAMLNWNYERKIKTWRTSLFDAKKGRNERNQTMNGTNKKAKDLQWLLKHCEKVMAEAEKYADDESYFYWDAKRLEVKKEIASLAKKGQ